MQFNPFERLGDVTEILSITMSEQQNSERILFFLSSLYPNKINVNKLPSEARLARVLR